LAGQCEQAVRFPDDRTRAIIRLYRIFRLLLTLVAGVATVAILFPFYSPARRKRAIGRWSARVLAALNIESRIRGAPPDARRPAILIANHVSWLDIQLIHSLWQVRFVAKSEVRRWPVIGWLSARAGTLFIERGRHRHAARINRAIHAAFVAGDAIGIFPEGTTTEGTQLHRFHASLLQPAVDEKALIFPVALRYLDGDNRLNINASYVGETSLLESLRRILSEPRIIAELIFLPAIDTDGKSRRDLATETRAAIATALNIPVP
jgi:1-acyl-sn-glycerol-3-phosphate acyltransferase